MMESIILPDNNIPEQIATHPAQFKDMLSHVKQVCEIERLKQSPSKHEIIALMLYRLGYGGENKEAEYLKMFNEYLMKLPAKYKNPYSSIKAELSEKRYNRLQELKA